MHPNHNLKDEWVDTLNRVLDLNRSLPNQLPPTEPAKPQPEDEDYDSDSSAKRSWLYWWRWLCVWMDGLSWHLTSQLADLCRLIRGVGVQDRPSAWPPQSLTMNGWDWLNTLATLWCRERLVKAALLVGVLGSMWRAECVVYASSERQSSVDIYQQT